MEPKQVKIGWVEVPNSWASRFAVRLSIPPACTTRSAAWTISSLVNLFGGAIFIHSFRESIA